MHFDNVQIDWICLVLISPVVEENDHPSHRNRFLFHIGRKCWPRLKCQYINRDKQKT